MERIDISDIWLDTASKEDLDRILICFNDGQGDHCVYDYDRVRELLCMDYDLGDMLPSVIIDTFYNDLDLGGNGSDAIYFDNGYKIIDWI